MAGKFGGGRLGALSDGKRNSAGGEASSEQYCDAVPEPSEREDMLTRKGELLERGELY